MRKVISTRNVWSHHWQIQDIWTGWSWCLSDKRNNKETENLELNYLFVGLVASLYKRDARPKRSHLHFQSRGRFFRSIGCPSMYCCRYFQSLRYLHMQCTKQEDTSDKQPCL